MAEPGLCCIENCCIPAIGICQGFEEPCDNPLCSAHSIKSLCPDCNEKYVKSASEEILRNAIADMYNEFSDRWCEIVSHYLNDSYVV